MSHDDWMQVGRREYATALEVLRARGYQADFTQTGGMCAALEVRLERGHLLITDPSDELPWIRADQRGWGVGFYETDDASEGPTHYVEDDENSSDERLVQLLDSCMRGVAHQRAARDQ